MSARLLVVRVALQELVDAARTPGAALLPILHLLHFFTI